MFVHQLAETFDCPCGRVSDLLKSNGKNLVCGIVFSGKISALQQRSLFAFRVAAKSGKALWYQPALYDAARNLNEKKAADSRLFHKDLTEIPGLFIDMVGPYAAANPMLVEKLKPQLEQVVVSRDSAEREKEEANEECVGEVHEEEINGPDVDAAESLHSQIAGILRGKRIARFETIEEEFCRTTSGAPASVGPIMINSSLFARYAPGWWGTSGLELTDPDIELLCTEKDLQLYVEAKHGGGLIEIFSFWTAKMEYRWCRWAEQNAPRELFESLLSVIEPETWPLPLALKGQWARKKTAHGIFRLHAPKATFGSGITDFASYYGLIMLAMDRGLLGYAAIAHFLGWRFMTDRRAFSTMAVMIAIGALEPEPEHQTPHRVGPRAKEWLDRMSNNYAYDPESAVLDWPKKLYDVLMSKQSNSEFGWFSITDLHSAIPHWKGFQGMGQETHG